MQNKYFNRIIDKKIEDYLNVFGAIYIKGPKWCGKTTSSERFAKSIVKFQDENQRAKYDSIMAILPNQILEGENPRLIDEWQVYPVVWNCVRNEVDIRNKPGQFILTGSTTPMENPTLHTGTGRIAKIVMRPMSLYESKESNGKISLKEIFDNPNLKIDGIKSNLDLKDLIFATCRGGWPSSVKLKDAKSQLLIAREYFNSLCEEDINKVDGTIKNPARAKLFLKSYARNVSTLATYITILDDIKANDGQMSETNYYAYLNAFKKIYVIEEVEAWCPSIRSASAIRSTNKKEFVDPSIAVAALGLTPENLLNDLNTFGLLFENLCFRDIRIYSDNLGAQISYYHDRYDLEADCVLRLEDDRYALIEFKLGDKFVEEGAQHLLYLKNLIIKNNEKNSRKKLREPDVLMVVTGGEFAYKREDGVLVVPIGCLKD